MRLIGRSSRGEEYSLWEGSIRAATGGVLQKKVFVKILQISQEDFEEHLRTVASTSFIRD